ncbi:MAG: TonB-dependent receptor [Acidobacteriota bacterium]|nr:TonB-dependent receptor [Acidobacteriota bacterium]
MTYRFFWLLGCTFIVLGLAVGAKAEDRVAVTVDGFVGDQSGRRVAGATVEIGAVATTTNEDGTFTLRVASGQHSLRVSHPSFLTVRQQILVRTGMGGLDVRLEIPLAVSETITVSAVRAGDEVPVTKKTIGRAEIDSLSYGQDLPSLIQYTPSVTWYSDSGVGSNYSYFSLRGINQTRINMTLDGAPLNDPAEHALFFNNFHDFASAVDSIQIQRGVGTSTVGSPAFGGSINFASSEPGDSRETTVRFGVGSFDTRRASVSFESGRLDSGLAFSGRLSFADSNGFRERSGTKHHTLFFNALWEGEKSRLKLVSFAGRERSQLAFLAVEPGTLQRNARFNPLADEEKDRFGQQFVQLQYSKTLGERKVLVASLYANGADGWFRLWDDASIKTNLLQFGIDQQFVGSMINLTRVGARLTTTVGFHYNDFRGDHTLDLGARRVYRNTGLKHQANAFVKSGFDIGDWHLYADLQLRWAQFDYRGDVELDAVSWTFVDPKVGARRRLSPRASVYVSLGKAEREPSRLDLLAGEDNASVMHDLRAVRPERVIDLEAGLEYESSNVVLQAVLYSMEFVDEIAATGELSEVGLPLRVNVEESYRRGVELDVRWGLGGGWALGNTTNLSRNRIRQWTQFYDVYDEDGSWLASEPRVHRGVEHLLTPEVLVTQSLQWHGERWGRAADAALTARWVGPSNLDNTGNRRFRAPGHLTLDWRGSLDTASGSSVTRSSRRPRVTLHINNLLDARDRYPSGYSYLFVTRDEAGRDMLDGVPFYYPLAGRNVSLTMDFTL